MLLVGLTGSLAMGKTETARMFAGLGVPVFDADAEVHHLYAVGGAAVGPVAEAFP
jgi:dephospho-CoA kinase